LTVVDLDDHDFARVRTERLIADLRDCPIPKLARLGRTLHAWRNQLTAHEHPSVSNGPAKNLNLKIKHTKRTARGCRNFADHRLRLASARISHPQGSEPAVPGLLP
jgi:transposase